MDKELALAIDFKKAPKEVQDAATEHYTNVKKVAQIEKKQVQNNLDLFDAKQKADQSAKALRLALKTWEPEV